MRRAKVELTPTQNKDLNMAMHLTRMYILAGSISGVGLGFVLARRANGVRSQFLGGLRQRAMGQFADGGMGVHIDLVQLFQS
jgi:hypothetical protein